MVFSSTVFLLLFLPIAVVGYYALARPKARNLWLLGASLVFYAWGEAFYVLLLLTTILVNWLFGYLLAKTPHRGLLAVGVAINLGLLGHFKYADFLVDNLNRLLGMEVLAAPSVHLPLGVSFFIFQAISYVVDIYRQQARAERSFVNVALYIALFPQLVAGPIVRYAHIARQLKVRDTNLSAIASGTRLFIAGLAKKVLIANVLGQTADNIFALESNSLSAGVAWLGVVCYSLQIYFDFSGYSDMAIGLGRIFGFDFPKNFRHPYSAASVRDFWRRWHISLSTWFRDYLYIPLGGSRHGRLRTSVNLIVVFLLCGLLHGASWNFVLWGAFHGVFLSLERFVNLPSNKFVRILGHIYVLLVVMLAWVLFRTETVSQAGIFYTAMIGLNDAHGLTSSTLYHIDLKVALSLAFGIVLSLPVAEFLATRIRLGKLQHAAAWSGDAVLAGLLFLCVIMIAAGTYNPFIYFRF